MVIALESSCRIRAVAQAAIEAEEVIMAFAHALLARALGNAVTLATARRLRQLVVSQAQRAGPHVTAGPEVRWMAAALSCVEIANASYFVWTPMKLIVAHFVACGR